MSAAGPLNFKAKVSVSVGPDLVCSWSEINTEDSYLLYLSTTPGNFTGSPETIQKGFTGEGKYIFFGLTIDVHYYLKLVSVTGVTSSAPVFFDMIIADSPSNFTASATSSTEINCTWSKVQSADSYKLGRGRSGSIDLEDPTQAIDIPSNSVLSYPFTGLDTFTTY